MGRIRSARSDRTLEFSLWVPWTLTESFEFFGDVQKLNDLTPTWFHLRVLSRTPVRPSVGTRIDYLLRWRGMPMRWQSVVTVWQPPEKIVYRQGRGPYRFFDHEHLFMPEGKGVRVVDRVTFAVFGGRVVRDLLVAPELRRIFGYRRQRVEEWVRRGSAGRVLQDRP